MKFDLNVSLVLKEVPPLDRFERAARLGFGAVEMWWPPDGVNIHDLARRIRDAGLQLVTMNFYAGDLAAGERGVLNHPAKAAAFRANVPLAVEVAHGLGCPNLTAIVGQWLPGEQREPQLQRAADNLAFAAERAAAAGRTVLVEALNSLDNGPYMLTGTAETLAFMDRVGAPNLRYQLDLFHMQRMGENLVDSLRLCAPRLGHIQIADCPGRHQPGTGAMDWPALFRAIDGVGYDGWVGLEYVPQGPVEETLGWMS